MREVELTDVDFFGCYFGPSMYFLEHNMLEKSCPAKNMLDKVSVQVQSNAATELMQCKRKFEQWATEFGIEIQRV
jgi:hypothetical protein